MAWEWSHTQEAYNNAKRNMEALDRATREVIAAEWMGTPSYWHKTADGVFRYDTNLDLKRYYKALCRVKRWTDKKMNEFIWKNMEELATCTNGGWEAYCCPHGCGCHMVSFGHEHEED
jgi:hypothetical protein